jgi:hypothetical protein
LKGAAIIALPSLRLFFWRLRCRFTKLACSAYELSDIVSQCRMMSGRRFRKTGVLTASRRGGAFLQENGCASALGKAGIGGRLRNVRPEDVFFPALNVGIGNESFLA